MTLAMPPVANTPVGRRYIVRNEAGEKVGSAELRMVPVIEIRIDPAYQRDDSKDWIKDHLPFNPHKCGAIILSARGGGLYCIDGQHRWLLAKTSGVTHIAALVITGLSKKDEAGAFVDYQQERRALTSWQLFRAELVNDREEAKAVEAAVLRAGFKIRRKREDDRCILTIDSLRRVFRLGGGAKDLRLGQLLIEDTLRWIGEVWLGEDGALSAGSIYGLALFLNSSQNRPEWNETFLRKAMNLNGPSKMVRHAQRIAVDRKSVSMSASDFAEAVLEQYNKIAPQDKRISGLVIGSRKRPRA